MLNTIQFEVGLINPFFGIVMPEDLDLLPITGRFPIGDNDTIKGAHLSPATCESDTNGHRGRNVGEHSFFVKGSIS